MKKYIFLIIAIILVLAGCDKEEVAKNENNELTTNEGNITIKGSSNYEFSMSTEGAVYLVIYKEKAKGSLKNLEMYVDFYGEWTSLMPQSFMALRDNGWYEGSIIQSYGAGNFDYKVTAVSDYQIEFHKLPLSKTAESLPKTYTGAGGTVFGPVSISSDATFVITCADANQAGFTVELVEATTGEKIYNPGYKPLYVNLDENSNAINNINTTITKYGLSGNYLIAVNANIYANYTVGIQ